MGADYINNKALEDLVAEYKRLKKAKKTKSKEFIEIEDKLVKVFYILVDNISRAFKFQLIEAEDMMQEAVMLCFEKLHRFDPDYVSPITGKKSRLFNFLSTIVLNAARQLYRNSKSHKQLQERYFDHLSKNNHDYIMHKIYNVINDNND